MSQVTCPCGQRFDATSPRARYCSATCRKRGSRAGLRVAPVSSPAAAAPPLDEAPPVAEVGSVVAATIADLSDAGALGTPAGLAAVKLAQLVDGAGSLAGSSVAAWVREMRAALAEAKQKAPAQEVDPIDELERKRRARSGT